jgi:hypothetical protein
MRNSYKVFDRKAERSRPIQRPVFRWKDTIETNFKEMV